MKMLRGMLAGIVILGFSFSAQAEFGIGVFGSHHMSDSYSFSGPTADQAKARGGSSYGALAFIPMLPYFSIRTGIAYEKLKYQTSYLGGAAAVDQELSNMLIPLNVHFEFPVSGLYAFGGVIFATNQKTDPDTAGKAKSDTRTNVGLGYDVFVIPPVTLSAEVEYQKGSNNLSPDSNYDLKVNNLNLNVMARFTL